MIINKKVLIGIVVDLFFILLYMVLYGTNANISESVIIFFAVISYIFMISILLIIYNERKFNLCLDSACILPLHRLISQSSYGYDFKIWIIAEFFPQSADMYVNCTGFCFCIQSPDFIH